MKNVLITINVPDDVIADFLSHPSVITVLQRAFSDVQQRQRQNDHEQPDATTLDLSEAANLLGLAVSTTRDKAARREIPGVKTGKMWRFFRADLIKWLEGNRRRTKVEIAQQAEQYVRSSKKRR